MRHHDSEVALGSDHERREVEARHALDGAVPEAQEAPVGQHDVEAQYGVAHDAVLRAQQPPAPVAMLPPTVEMRRLAGSGAHHRSYSASAAFRSALMIPGSTTGEQIYIGTHLEDRVHRAHRQHDLARPAHSGARETRAGTARDDRGARRGRNPHRPLDILDRCRMDDSERPA